MKRRLLLPKRKRHLKNHACLPMERAGHPYPYCMICGRVMKDAKPVKAAPLVSSTQPRKSWGTSEESR